MFSPRLRRGIALFATNNAPRQSRGLTDGNLTSSPYNESFPVRSGALPHGQTPTQDQESQPRQAACQQQGSPAEAKPRSHLRRFRQRMRTASRATGACGKRSYSVPLVARPTSAGGTARTSQPSTRMIGTWVTDKARAERPRDRGIFACAPGRSCRGPLEVARDLPGG